MPNLRFTPPDTSEPGTIASVLRRVYAPLVERCPATWNAEEAGWDAFDAEVFRHPDTVGACTFFTWWGDLLVGFGSYDPRGAPDLGILGHSGVLPEFQGRGLGKAQVEEILRRMRCLGIRRARVSTGGHPFFAPARRMYLACGFREARRVPWERDPQETIIEYEKAIGEPEAME